MPTTIRALVKLFIKQLLYVLTYRVTQPSTQKNSRMWLYYQDGKKTERKRIVKVDEEDNY